MVIPDTASGELKAGFAALTDHYVKRDSAQFAWRPQLPASIAKVGSALDVIRAKYEAHLKASKGRFNLFTVLRDIGEENGLHSNWLAYLLDPHGEHDCGPLFLDLFLSTLKDGVQPHSDHESADNVPFLQGFDSANAVVKPEVPIDDGRIDLWIECPRWGVIAIENKIWAGEQDNQIWRYARYLRTRKSRDGREFLLLYLTLDGRSSNTAVELFHDYRRISYREHITGWLQECLRATYQHIGLNQALQQYAAVVGKLAGSGTNQEIMDEIIELLREHPAIIAHLNDITSAVDRLQERYWQEFCSQLRAQLAEKGIQTETKDSSSQYPKLVCSTPQKLPVDDIREFRFVFEWQKKEGWFVLGATVHHLDEAARMEVWSNRERYSSIMERIAAVAPLQYRRTINSFWPLGDVRYFTEFLRQRYLAANAAKHSTPIADQVRPIVESACAVIEAATSGWARVIR